MAAYRRVYDSRHLQADCQEPGSAPEPYAGYSSMGYPFLLLSVWFSCFYGQPICKGEGREERGDGKGGEWNPPKVKVS